jgi:2-phosphoglycolate phosphatase
MTRPAAFLFDLDGTLLDTAPDMIGALNRLLREEQQTEVTPGAARRHVSHGAARLVKIGFPAADGAQFERLRLRFLDLYAAGIAQQTSLFAGLADVLETLERERVPWGIVTNKPGWLTEPLLRQLALHERAACIVSGDTVAERKPHPLPLLHAAECLGIVPTACVYVGDAERDIQAGRAAGMRTIAAAYGYIGSDEDPQAWGPDAIVGSPLELLSWIRH